MLRAAKALARSRAVGQRSASSFSKSKKDVGSLPRGGVNPHPVPLGTPFNKRTVSREEDQKRWGDEKLWDQYIYLGKNREDLVPERYKHIDFLRLEEELDQSDHEFFSDDYDHDPEIDNAHPESWLNRPSLENIYPLEAFRKQEAHLRNLAGSIKDAEEDLEGDVLLKWLFEVDANSHQRVTKAGRVMSYSCLLMGGNGQGCGGWGYGRGSTSEIARINAKRAIRKNMIFVPLLENRTLFRSVIGSHNGTKVLLQSVRRGKGMKGAPLLRCMLTMFGIKECTTKIIGHPDRPISTIYAAFEGLSRQASWRELAVARGQHYYKWYERGNDPVPPPSMAEMQQQKELATALVVEALQTYNQRQGDMFPDVPHSDGNFNLQSADEAVDHAVDHTGEGSKDPSYRGGGEEYGDDEEDHDEDDHDEDDREGEKDHDEDADEDDDVDEDVDVDADEDEDVDEDDDDDDDLDPSERWHSAARELLETSTDEELAARGINKRALERDVRAEEAHLNDEEFYKERRGLDETDRLFTDAAKWERELARRERLNPVIGDTPSMEEPEHPIWHALSPAQKRQVQSLYQQWFKVTHARYGPINDKARALVRQWVAEDLAELQKTEPGALTAPRSRQFSAVPPPRPPSDEKYVVEREGEEHMGPIIEGDMSEFAPPADPPEEQLVQSIAQQMYEDGTEETNNYAPDHVLEETLLYGSTRKRVEAGELPTDIVAVPREIHNVKDALERAPKWLSRMLDGDGLWVSREQLEPSSKYPPEVPMPRL